MRREGDSLITALSIVLLVISIILLFFVSFLIFELYDSNNFHSGNVVVNLDNSNYQETNCKQVRVPYSVRVPYKTSYLKKISTTDYLSRSSEERKTGYLGNYIDEYTVYVKNEGYDIEYFEVEFVFRDYSGKKSTYRISKYIEDGEEESFMYRDIYADKSKHKDFSYKISGPTGYRTERFSEIDYRWETKYKWEEVCW